MMAEFLINNFSIEIQPKQNFHFRYVTDLNSTHGAVKGQQGEYPRIKLLLPENGLRDDMDNSRDFYVLCTLHAYDENQSLSPHHLMLKGSNINDDPIFKKMERSESSLTQLNWELKDYVIVREKMNNLQKSLEIKKKYLEDLKLPQDFIATLSGNLDLENKDEVKNSGICNVCLGFTIFERIKDKDTYSLYKETIYSCNIYNGDNLKIHDICNTKGNINGGTKVTLLMKIDSNLKLNVHMKKIDEENKETLWSNIIPIDKKSIFENAAIQFITPRYNGPIADNEEEIKVLVSVVVENSSYKSNEAKFYYIHEPKYKRKKFETDNSDMGKERQEKLRKVCIVSSDCGNENATIADLTEIFKKLNNSEGIEDLKYNFNNIVDNIFDNNKELTEYTLEDLDKIFHWALKSRTNLIYLYKKAIESQNKHLITDYRNDNRKNLLHLACAMNHNWAIRPLIRLGCHINQQDYHGRTPLHIALLEKNNGCILEIQKLINDPSEYSKEFEQDVIRMFNAYNHNGYTVLHLAYLGGYDELLEDMFKFLKKHNLNILDYEVLGNGDTIAHLAFKNNGKLSLIEKYIPNYMEATNYGGTTVKDLQKN